MTRRFNHIALLLSLGGCVSQSELGTIRAHSDDDSFAEQRAACAFSAGAMTETTFGASVTSTPIPIETFIILVQENRAFDHYYSQLPNAGQPDVEVAAPDASNPDSDGRPVFRYHESNYCIPDANHGWDGMHYAWNYGANDGFVRVNNNLGHALAYYDDSDLPFYYRLAVTFSISDRYFAPTLTQTMPNRYYLYSGTSEGGVDNDHPEPSDSIFQRLEDAGISWHIYTAAGTVDYSYESSYAIVRAHPERYGTIEDFASDAAANRLASVVFVSAGEDEHPGYGTGIQAGQHEVWRVYNALRVSPDQWRRSALLFTYDENGGLYDHFPPPPACAPDNIPPDIRPDQFQGTFAQYGFRVPLIVASPWSRRNYASHVVNDHTSILRLLELRFHLPALTGRDANANALFDLFDFTVISFPDAPVIDEPTINRCSY